MIRRARITVNGKLAGILSQNDRGYHFSYTAEYVKSKEPKPVSLTLPLRESPYFSRTLFPFFDGLIPEGWLLNVVETNWKINPRDRMGLLLVCCKDCIGNVGVEAIEEEAE